MTQNFFSRALTMALAASVAAFGCTSDDEKTTPEIAKERPELCVIQAGAAAPDYLTQIGCRADFDAMASEPLDASIPGARSVKILLDTFDNDALYFQNSQKFLIHYDFASKYLSGNGKPIIPLLSEFNRTEYYAPDRRFILGAITYYQDAQTWTLELSPYDKATPAMMEKIYRAVHKAAYFGPVLAFHPTSEAMEKEAKSLPTTVKVMTTKELFAEIDYQPLNVSTAVGRLHFAMAANLETEYLGLRDIVVLDRVPNDISVVSGLITEEFQTPLSHVNVLAQQRKTPNMGLRGAMTDPKLRALDGKWVKLVVGAFAWSIEEVTQAEADAFWEARKPAPVKLPEIDKSITELRDVDKLVVEGTLPLKQAIAEGVRAFGAKAAQYSILAKTEGVPTKKGFAIPVFYYTQFMEQNGFYTRVDQLLADESFKNDPKVRDQRLLELREAMQQAPVDENFLTLLKTKMNAEYPGLDMRFRSSTNAEDLEGFPCAGCYESRTGRDEDWQDVIDAVRTVWAGIWFFRTFEEREYHGIDHKSVAMAMLVHNNFPTEEANGVAITANPFDVSGLEPGFYVNVQVGGEAEVVHPPPGVTSDQFVYYFNEQGQPITYLAHSNLVNDGETVLSTAQVFELGTALDAIHRRFSAAYGPASGNTGWYAMDVEFKFDGEPGEVPRLFVKQARPYPGRGE